MSKKVQNLSLHPPVGRQPKLADQIYDDLLRDIVSQRLEDGQRLPGEISLCERFGVSRPVLREALARLKADGLLVAKQGAGNFISTPQEGELVRPAGRD
ncbi:MAG: FadR/GntR family transcriptional regulator, partial [Pseudorhodoplanes sp.]